MRTLSCALFIQTFFITVIARSMPYAAETVEDHVNVFSGIDPLDEEQMAEAEGSHSSRHNLAHPPITDPNTMTQEQHDKKDFTPGRWRSNQWARNNWSSPSLLEVPEARRRSSYYDDNRSSHSSRSYALRDSTPESEPASVITDDSAGTSSLWNSRNI